MTDNKAFRDYATRVSFNLSVSRNQVSALRSVVMDVEAGHWGPGSAWQSEQLIPERIANTNAKPAKAKARRRA